MPANPKPDDPKIADHPTLHRVLEDVARTGSEMERRRGDALLGKDRLFAVIEQQNPERRLIAYLVGPGGGPINMADAAPIGSMLDAIGKCASLDLMLNSHGGFGETAEKIVEMCRAHCRSEFRVIVPNFAKSAATLIALGADIIVMGYLSELGPIDPQITLVVGGAEQSVSGQSFIQAYDSLQEKIRETLADGESPVGYLQSLAASSMEPAFVEHCRRGVDFSSDLAQKFLQSQLKVKHKGKKSYTKKKIEEIAAEGAENLLSKEARFSHGRLIGGEEARDQVGLNVQLLDQDDPVWQAYWELYVRAEVYMQTLEPVGGRPAAKLFFDRDSTLPGF